MYQIHLPKWLFSLTDEYVSSMALTSIYEQQDTLVPLSWREKQFDFISITVVIPVNTLFESLFHCTCAQLLKLPFHYDTE